MPFESCFGLTVKRYVDGRNDLIGAEEYKNKTQSSGICSDAKVQSSMGFQDTDASG